jgi:hypothetical protein
LFDPAADFVHPAVFAALIAVADFAVWLRWSYNTPTLWESPSSCVAPG